MRMVVAILSAAVAALTMLASPVLAKNAEAQKVGEPAAASPCSSYQQNPDGTWTRIPCQELGTTQRQTRPSTHSSNESR
jgi:hypothetical protein